MPESFFLESKPKENQVYAGIRDHPSRLVVKQQIERLWDSFYRYAPRGFRKSAQIEFYQRWWEMYLAVGLDNIDLIFTTSAKDTGPDFQMSLDANIKLWIEAIAPKSGEGPDALPDQVFDDGPEREFIFRLARAISTKQSKFNSYRANKMVTERDISIIAVSACNLNQFGTMMDWPNSVILKLVAGARYLSLPLKGSLHSEPFITYRSDIEKKTGNRVPTNIFLGDEYKFVSGILYSRVDPLNAMDKPEDTLQLFLNPHAVNRVPVNLFEDIEVWQLREENTWIKIHKGQNPESSTDSQWI